MAEIDARVSPERVSRSLNNTSPLERSTKLRCLRPKEPGDGGIPEVTTSKAKGKQARSCNGCITCKQRRIKCDETKPFCRQCSRRKVMCGGYVRRIRWINAGWQHHVSPIGTFTTELSATQEAENSASQALVSAQSGVSNSGSPVQSKVGSGHAIELDAMSDCHEHETAGKVPLSLPVVAQATSPDDHQDSVDAGVNASFLCDCRVGSSGQDSWPQSYQAFSFSKAKEAAGQTPSALYQQPQFSAASPENIALLYHHQASDILSIRDHSAMNPWQSHIWPLAKDNKALYHALAAMTCLYISKAQPSLRIRGVNHAQESLESLVHDVQRESVCVEAAIAASLALGFGDTFDPKAGSTSLKHTVGVKLLLQQLISQQQQPAAPRNDTDILCFLAGNWMYMDVIARFTSENDAGPLDYNFLNVCVFLQRPFTTSELDPLMGCAISLFPDLGRVADLVRRVRSADSNSNSLAIVSAAAHLQTRIEQWMPTISISAETQRTQNVSDAFQTAEAYRWAALLLLRQAVPELVWTMSLQEMAQKILVFLATISHTSRTVVIQILPLVIAGCEAINADDRAWVRERWLAMSRRMLTAIVDKCLSVTQEVWRRRDIDAHDEGLYDVWTHNPSSSFSTRSTVKGKLHWMQVMRDWNWEVMLG